MEMIDRYVHAVTERLPEDTREDVARELRANIEDMLPEDPTDKDIRAVLEKLGNPAVLSNEYRPVKRYLIGPAMYDTYLSVLKLVVGIAAIVFTFLALIGAVSKPHDGDALVGYTGNLIANVLSAAFQGAVQAFLWVTFVFALMERAGVQEGQLPFVKKAWTVDDLPVANTSSRGRISRAEAVVSLVFTVIFISIFLFRPELFGWYESGENGLKLIQPVFDIARLQSYIPGMVILAVLQFGMSLYKFVARRWTLPLAIINTINNLGLSILVYMMLNDHSLINQALLGHVAGILHTSSGKVELSLGNGLQVFLVIFVILCGIDSISGFVKCRKLPSINIPKVQ